MASSTNNAANTYPLALLPAVSGFEKAAPEALGTGVRRNSRTGRPLASRRAIKPEESSRDRPVVTLNESADCTADESKSFKGCAVNDPLTEFASCATIAVESDRLKTTQPRNAFEGACPVTGRAMIHRSPVKVAMGDARFAPSD